MKVNDKVRFSEDHPSGLFKEGWEGVIVFMHTAKRFDVELTLHGKLLADTVIGAGFEKQVLVDESEVEKIGESEDTIYRRGSIITLVDNSTEVVEQNAVGGCFYETTETVRGKEKPVNVFVADAQIREVDPQEEAYQWALQQDNYNSIFELKQQYQAEHSPTPGLYGIIIEARNYNLINEE